MPHPVFTDDYIRKMCPENHPFSLKELSMYRDTKPPKYLEKKPGIKYVPMPVRPPVTKSALARRMVPLGNKEQLLNAHKAIENLLKEGGSAGEGAAEGAAEDAAGGVEEEKDAEGGVEEEKDAEGGVAVALDHEEIGDNLADMTTQNEAEVAQNQGLNANEAQQLQAQVQGAQELRRSPRRPRTPVGAGSSKSSLTPEQEERRRFFRQGLREQERVRYTE